MKTMPLPEIIAALVKINGCNDNIASTFLNEFAALVAEGLADSGRVTVKGIGTFRLIELADDVSIEFAPDKILADAVNAPFSIFEPVELDDCVTADMLNDTTEYNQSDSADHSSDENPTTLQTEIAHADEIDRQTDCNTRQAIPAPPQQEPKQSQQKAPAGLPPIPTSNKLPYSATPDATTNTPLPQDEPSGNDGLAHEEPTPSSTQRLASDNYLPENPQPQVTHERIIEKEHLIETADKSRHTFHIVLASVISLLAGLIIGYFAYSKLNLSGVKSVNISADDVKVIHQVAGSNAEGIAAKESADHNTAPHMATDTLSQPDDSVPDNSVDICATPANTTAIGGNKKDATHVVTDTVKSNHYLTTMALKHYGKKKFWVYIYEENKEKLPDPDMIPANTIVVIPPASKYGIRPGDPASEADAEKRAVEIAKRQH